MITKIFSVLINTNSIDLNDKYLLSVLNSCDFKIFIYLSKKVRMQFNRKRTLHVTCSSWLYILK